MTDVRRRARELAAALSVVLAAGACGSGGLSEAERAWCMDHHRTVVDTMDLLYPYHWEGNEAAKAEALPVFQQLEAGEIDQQEADRLLTEITTRYWPAEYERGCRTAYAER